MVRRNLYLLIAALVFFIGECQGQGYWTQKTNHQGAPRYDFAGFSVNGKGYIGGGRYSGPLNAISDWQQYDPATNTWSTITPMPYPYTAINAFAVSGHGYVVNGVNTMTYDYDTYRYNHLTNNWDTASNTMIYPRLYAACASDGTKAYVAGGYGFGAEPLRDLWVYDPASGIWTEKDTLPLMEARYNAAAFPVNGDIYIFGGWDDLNYLNDLWKYNPATDQWSPMDTMPAIGREQCLAFVLNGEAYIVGGSSAAGSLKEVWKYDAAGNSWLQLADFPGAIAPFGGAAFTIGGKGYIVPGNGTTECWEYDPGTVDTREYMRIIADLPVYPSPVRSSMIIKANNDAISTIEIYNTAGQLILSRTVVSSEIKVDCNAFSPGIYFIKGVRSDGKPPAMSKFVKQ